MTSLALKSHLTSPLAMRLIPYLALFAGMVTLAGGTSFAKTLFPIIGAEGTSASRPFCWWRCSGRGGSVWAARTWAPSPCTASCWGR